MKYPELSANQIFEMAGFEVDEEGNYLGFDYFGKLVYIADEDKVLEMDINQYLKDYEIIEWNEANYDVQSGGKGMTLQVGANYGQTISFGINDMSSVALGVNGTKVNCSTQVGAQNSIENIDKAIASVSKQRSLLGAIQNRLEHTISNLDNTAENLQSAESGIRDVDMASEMVTFSKNNILQQAAQSMLAQANQANQGVLSLLG